MLLPAGGASADTSSEATAEEECTPEHFLSLLKVEPDYDMLVILRQVRGAPCVVVVVIIAGCHVQTVVARKKRVSA